MLALALASFAVYLTLKVIRPCLDKTKKQRSHVFWESICEFAGEQDYAESFGTISTRTIIEEICHENYLIAKIAHRKYEWFKEAVFFALVSVVVSILATAGWTGFDCILQALRRWI